MSQPNVTSITIKLKQTFNGLPEYYLNICTHLFFFKDKFLEIKLWDEILNILKEI